IFASSLSAPDRNLGAGLRPSSGARRPPRDLPLTAGGLIAWARPRRQRSWRRTWGGRRCLESGGQVAGLRRPPVAHGPRRVGADGVANGCLTRGGGGVMIQEGWVSWPRGGRPRVEPVGLPKPGLRAGRVPSGPEVNGDGGALHTSCSPVVADLPAWTGIPEGGLLKLATTGQFLTMPALDRACLCAGVAEHNKARDVVVLDMRGITPLYDFFVISTGTSRRQIHTITEEIDAALREVGDRRLSVEGYEGSKWVVQDYGDVVV